MADRVRFRLPWMTSGPPRRLPEPRQPSRPAVEPPPEVVVPDQAPALKPAEKVAIAPDLPLPRIDQQTESYETPSPLAASAEEYVPKESLSDFQVPAPQSPSLTTRELQAPSQPLSSARAVSSPKPASQSSSPPRSDPLLRSPSRLGSRRDTQAALLPSSPSRRVPEQIVLPSSQTVDSQFPVKDSTVSDGNTTPEAVPARSILPSATESFVPDQQAIPDLSSNLQELPPRADPVFSPISPIEQISPPIPDNKDGLDSTIFKKTNGTTKRSTINNEIDEMIQEEKAVDSAAEERGIEPYFPTKLSEARPESTLQPQMPPIFIYRPQHDLKKGTRLSASLDPVDSAKLSESRKKDQKLVDEQGAYPNYMKGDISKLVNKVGTSLQNQPLDSSLSVVNLAGENTGAVMNLGSESSKRDGPIHIVGKDPKPNPPDGATEGEASTKAYVNSNAQCINNSILLRSSINEGNPGVSLAFSSNPTPIRSSVPKTSFATVNKAQAIAMAPEKLTQEPRVRRRCLRGLFLEPSDSESEDSGKPPRHGCRHCCGDQSIVAIP